MSILFKKEKKERQKTRTESRSFLGVMIDPEIDSYLLLLSEISNSTKSEEVRKALGKAYNASISDAIRNIARKILITTDNDPPSVSTITVELKKQGIHKDHVERIIEVLWKELQSQDH
jgi:hypothetical protein